MQSNLSLENLTAEDENLEALAPEDAEALLLEEGEDGEEAEAPEPEPEDRRWFVIHTYSGYENKVKTNLEHRIDSMGVGDKIHDVVIPTEEQVEIKDGQRRTVQRKVFPGYVLVQMMVTEEGIPPNDAWYVVRNTPGVTGFVGAGSHPSPLEESEVKRILRRMKMEAPRVKVSFAKSERVKVVDELLRRVRRGVPAIAMSALVGRQHVVARGQSWRHVIPRVRVSREPVQQHDWRR